MIEINDLYPFPDGQPILTGIQRKRSTCGGPFLGGSKNDFFFHFKK